MELSKRTKKPEENIDHSSDEDDNAVDPFVHSLNLSTTDWIQTILLGIILVPIRIVLILFFMLLMWIVSSVSLRIVSRGKHIKILKTIFLEIINQSFNIVFQ